jgi:uncharacterized protein YoxC
MINILTVKDSLQIAWQGMLMIFIAIAFIYFVIMLFSLFHKLQKNKTKK